MQKLRVPAGLLILLTLISSPLYAVENAVNDCAMLPSVVRVSFGGGEGFCTATWIRSNVLVTAAHCADGDPSGFRVVAGTGEGSRPQRIIRHPRFRIGARGRHRYDIALVVFERRQTNYPQPVTYDPPAQNTQLNIAGYGSGRCQSGPNKPYQNNMGFVVVLAPYPASSQDIRRGVAVPESGDSGGPLLNPQGAIIGVAHQGTRGPIQMGGRLVLMGSYLLFTSPEVLQFLRANLR